MAEFYSRVWTLDDIEIVRAGKGGDGRTVSAYAAIYGTPTEIQDQHGHYMEQIDRAAFDRSLAHPGNISKILCLYNHGADLTGQPSALGSVPIGSPTEIRSDQRGLFTVTRFNRSELADAVLAAIDNGDIRGYSFRGRVFRSDPTRVPRIQRGGALPLVTRKEMSLQEYGPTPIPWYSEASIVAIRSALPQLRALPTRERIEIARALLDPADEPPQPIDLSDSIPEPDTTPEPEEDDGVNDTTTTPDVDPDESEEDEATDVEVPEVESPTPDDASEVDDESGLGTEDPAESEEDDEPLPPVDTARSVSAAEVRARARMALILRAGQPQGGK